MINLCAPLLLPSLSLPEKGRSQRALDSPSSYIKIISSLGFSSYFTVAHIFFFFLVKAESKCFLKINTPFYFLLESFKILIYRPFFLYSLSLTSIQTDNRLCVSCFLENRCASAERWYSLSGSLLEEMNSNVQKKLITHGLPHD